MAIAVRRGSVRGVKHPGAASGARAFSGKRRERETPNAERCQSIEFPAGSAAKQNLAFTAIPASFAESFTPLLTYYCQEAGLL
jgi:hypothetical protein